MKNDRKMTFLLITIPILALFVCFNTIPLIRGVVYSFTNFRGFGTYDWVGLRNYIDLFSDARVGKSYWFTFKLAVVSTIVTNVISLVLALALNSKIRAKSFFRGAYFLPNVLGALVVGYIFNYFFTYILPALTGTSSILSNPGTAWIGVVVVCAWHCHEYDHLYFRSSDCTGRCLRGGGAGWRNRMETVQISDVSADHPILFDQYGTLCQELPDGIRSDHGFD